MLSGTAPREVVSTIRQNTDHPIIKQDVYNIRNTLKLKNLAGKTPMEALISVLQTGVYTVSYKQDAAGRLTHLFFAHPKSIELLHRFPEVLIMDCTYKSNKFKFPLLNIIGTTCLNTSFYVAFAFLEDEVQESYTWALEQLKTLFQNGRTPDVLLMDRDLALIAAAIKVFPRPTTLLLCIWHVKTNVKAHAGEHIKDDAIKAEFLSDWSSLVASKTTNAYDDNWNDFQTKYDTRFPALVQYVFDTWLRKYKSFFVSAWVDKKLHLKNHATSRAEGAHGVLKRYLQILQEI